MVRQAYVEKVDNKTLMKAAITGMLSGLDPHSEYLDKEGLAQLNEDTTGEYSGLGIEVLQVDGGLRIVSPIDDTPAARAGIKPGDSIVKINGILIDPQNVDEMFKQLRGKPGSKIDLTIVHDNSDKLIDLHLVREKIAISSVKVRELEPGYAYLRISQFQEDTAGDLERKLAELIKKNGPQKGAVLDLRNNPGGLLTAAVGVSDDFLDSGVIVTTRGRLQDANMSFQRASRRPAQRRADDRADQQRHRVGGGDRVRCVEGQPSRADHGPAHVRQGRGADGAAAGRRPRGEDHHRALLHAERHLDPGRGHQARHRAGRPHREQGRQRPVPDQLRGRPAQHLANEAGRRPAGDINDDGSADDGKLATSDYALSQALNVLKGMALRQPATALR